MAGSMRTDGAGLLLRTRASPKKLSKDLTKCPYSFDTTSQQFTLHNCQGQMNGRKLWNHL